jgi:hypothetical protein
MPAPAVSDLAEGAAAMEKFATAKVLSWALRGLAAAQASSPNSA